MRAPYLATNDGEEVLDNAEIISDQIVGGLVAQLLPEKFEAKTSEWVDGFYLALEVVLAAGSKEARTEGLERMRQLVTGELKLD